jgi:hypothetical protein
MTAPNFADVNPEAFNAMIGNVDLNSDVQANLANEVIEAMMLGPPTTTAAIPTRTIDPELESSTTTTSTEPAATSVGSTTVAASSEEDRAAECLKKMKVQNSTQRALATVLAAECDISRTPDEVEFRFGLTRVASKFLDGSDSDNVDKWKCFDDNAPFEEGAPKTLRQIESYILSFMGCVNTSIEDTNSPYFKQVQTPTGSTKGVMSFKTSGADFVMNVDKLDPLVLRMGIRKTYPDYSGPEWKGLAWKNTKETISVPTGMFLHDPNCYDKPVTISSTILNK